MMTSRTVPVLIVGAGPVGVTMANLLGTYGIETLVIERATDVLDYPRAVGLDDEAMRTFQAAGVADELLKDMIQNVPMRMYTADRQCMAEILPATREFGWFRRNLFSQPLGERTMRQGLLRFPHVRLELGQELVRLEQIAEEVRVTVRGPDGLEREVRARYVLAADGARSTVRESLPRAQFEGKTHPHKWVVIECDQDPLDAPYTALHCVPSRPYVCLRLPYGLRRWEFMLFPGEDGEQMLAPDKVQELLGQHVENPAALNVIRARVYTHNSRVAATFVEGRVCLAGDAAHITPPWIGQGLNAGLRDAFNLSWKVAWILQGRLQPKVLQSYTTERHAHAKAMIDLADTFGALLSMKNPVLAWLRDRFLMAVRNIPSVRDYVLQMKFKPMPRFVDGVVLDSGSSARDDRNGRMFIQPMVEDTDGRTERLDDALGAGFALLSWQQDVLADAPPELQALLARLDCRQVLAVRSRSSPQGTRPSAANPRVTVIEDSENALHFWFQKTGVNWVLLRPDRYLAASGTANEVVAALQTFGDQFAMPISPLEHPHVP
jgi:3-(3-hydroxy-phenyl)propionate hydroxylase